MTRDAAIAAAHASFDDGAFEAALAALVAAPTDSTAEGSASDLIRYLETLIGPMLDRLGTAWRVVTPKPAGSF